MYPTSTQAFKEERAAMVALMRRRGISNAALLRVMEELPRHLFVDDVFRARAYEDSALPIACLQTISQPYTVAFMTEQLSVRSGDRVLEIGTGSGYQACVLAALGARVFTIERHFDLLQTARARFDRLGYNVASKVGDGTIGWSEFAPYQGIIVTAGAPDVPQSLLRQLGEGGRLVIPVGDEQIQTMRVITRRGDTFEMRDADGFKFVPLIGKEGWKR